MGVSHKEPMKFKTLTFKAGLNVTVRQGDKWLGSTGMYEATGPKKASAKIRVVETYHGVYKDLLLDNKMVLSMIHDPELRQYSKYFQFLRKCYPGRPDFIGEAEFSQDEEITVVFFIVTSWGTATRQEEEEEE